MWFYFSVIITLVNLNLERIPLNTEIRLATFFLIVFCLLFFFKADKPVIKVVVIESPAPVRKEISRGDTSKRQVIFTFDGGSEDVSGKRILDTLAKYQIRTSFFLTGQFVKNNPELVRRMKRDGHEIYNHTLNHPHLTEVADAEIVNQLEAMDNILKNVVGISTKPYFRPPYGDRDKRVLDVAFKAGYQSVTWTVDARDWQETEGMTREGVKSIILDSLANGNIYLIHIGDNITGDILEDVINETYKKGYKIVSLRQGL